LPAIDLHMQQTSTWHENNHQPADHAVMCKLIMDYCSRTACPNWWMKAFDS